MAKFLKADEVNSALNQIIANAKEQLILISPYIKLHDRIKDELKSRFQDDKLEITVVFGKNEDDRNKSLSPEDFNFLKAFPNIEIRYEKRLHAKYYCNEDTAILTSMNLHNYSQNNNIEFGILTKVKLVNGIISSVTGNENLDETAYDYFMTVIDNSELCFKRQPKYKTGWWGMSKDYLSSDTVVNKFDAAFVPPHDSITIKTSKEHGYCIRTGQKIKFNIANPYSTEGRQQWAKYGNADYHEKYCHFSGEPSNGETTSKRPILKKNWIAAKEKHKF